MSQFSVGDSAVNRLTAATDSFEKVLTEPEGVLVQMPIGPPQPSLAERLKRAVDAVTLEPAESAAQAAISAQKAALAEEQARQSAADAAGSAAATGYVAPPFPDVWAPLSDDLKMIAGYPVNTKLISFSRASTATYIDKSGVLQTAAVNEARFEKDGLLIEGQGTNFIPNSASTSPTWRVSNSTVTQTTITAPDGTTSGVTRLASLGADNTTTGTAISVPISSLSVGGLCAFSVFAKADTHNLIQLRWLGGPTGVSNKYLNVDLNTGEMGANTLSYAKTINMGNGWWRIIAVTTVDGDLTGGTSVDPGVELINSLSDGRRPAVSLAAGIGVYLYGPQLESGGCSSYIPTTGTAVTRADDIATITAVNGGFDYVTIACTVTRLWAPTSPPNSAPRIFSTRGSVAGSAWDTAFNTTGAVNSFGGQTNAGALVPGFIDGQVFTSVKTPAGLTTITPSGKTSGTQTTSPGFVSPLYVGNTKEVNRPLFGHIRNLRIWHSALSDIQIKGLR